jgi:uncharacterized membrane protein
MMQRLLAGLLLVASLSWAAALLAAPHATTTDGPVRVAAAFTYLGAGYICHQRPERSFHLDGHPLPVCARCTGLYLAAPFGLVGALFMRRRRTADDRTYRRWRAVIVAAAIPTIVSVGLEWIAGPGLSSNISRALAALPLGAALAAVVGAATLGHFGPSDTLPLTAPRGD